MIHGILFVGIEYDHDHDGGKRAPICTGKEKRIKTRHTQTHKTDIRGQSEGETNAPMEGASPNKSSGELVAHTTRSMSPASMPLISRAFLAASMPSERRFSGTTVVVVVVVAVVPSSTSSTSSPAPASPAAGSTSPTTAARRFSSIATTASLVPPCTSTLRSDMPVRVRIHSSDVSCTLSRSRFVTRVLGDAEPIPTGRTGILPPDAMRSDEDEDDDEDETR